MILAVAETPRERPWAVLNAEEAVMGIVRAALAQGERLLMLADQPLAWLALATAEEFEANEENDLLQIIVEPVPEADVVVYIGSAKRVNVRARMVYAIASSGTDIREARTLDAELADGWRPGEREESLPAIPLAMQLIVESLRY